MHKMRLMFKLTVPFSKHYYKFLHLKEIINIVMPLTVKQKIMYFPPTRLWTKHKASLKDTAGYKMKIIYHFDRFLLGKSRFFFYLFATNKFDTKFDHFNETRACRSLFQQTRDEAPKQYDGFLHTVLSKYAQKLI